MITRADGLSFRQSVLFALFPAEDNMGPRRRRVWGAIKPAVPSDNRRLIEGAPGIVSQLWASDRFVLRQLVHTQMPKAVFEVGTFNGGGSTHTLAISLRDCGEGKLYTVDVVPDLVDEAKRYIAACGLDEYVAFHLGDYRDAFAPYLDEAPADLVFLDGAEDAGQTLDQFEFFSERLSANGVIVCHDWQTDKSAGVRAKLSRGAGRWVIRQEIGMPQSVGIAVVSRR